MFYVIAFAALPLHVVGFTGAYFYWQDELVEDSKLVTRLEAAGLLVTSTMLLACGCWILNSLVGGPMGGLTHNLFAFFILVFETSGILLAVTLMCFIFAGRYFGRYKSSGSARGALFRLVS